MATRLVVSDDNWLGMGKLEVGPDQRERMVLRLPPGDAQIECDIPDNTVVMVQDGSLSVRSKVGNNCQFLVNATPAAEPTFGKSFLGTLFSRALKSEQTMFNVDFHGPVGDRCKLQGQQVSNVVLYRGLGSNATLDVPNAQLVALRSAEDHLRVHAKGSVRFTNIGDSSEIITQGRIQGAQTGKNSALITQGTLELGKCGRDSFISAHDYSVYEAGVGCSFQGISRVPSQSIKNDRSHLRIVR